MGAASVAMRFPSVERFHQYCTSKRRAYLRQFFERRSARGFIDLWRSEYEFAQSRFEIDVMAAEGTALLGRDIRWLLLQDLHQVVRGVVPDFPPAPPSVIAVLASALQQTRLARSMLISGERGTGKEQLAVMLHVLAGRPGALVRLAAAELGRTQSTPTRQMMPERGSVFIGDLEQLDPTAQEELITFLNGEARRRDLMFFVATEQEPRSLVAEHGIRRDLFVRVSQTEVRLPPLRERTRDVTAVIGDVLYDLTRVPADRLGELRNEARLLGEQWRGEVAGSPVSSDDLFAEALSYVMWREKKELVSGELIQQLAEEVGPETLAGNYRALRERVAARHDRIDRSVRRRDEQRPPGAGMAAGAADVTGDVEEKASRRRPAATRSERTYPEGAPLLPTQLSRDDLLRWYYQSLLYEEHGDLRRVAARAGRRLPSLHAELARLGVRLGGIAASNPSPGDA